MGTAQLEYVKTVSFDVGDVLEVVGHGEFVVGDIKKRGDHGRYSIRLDRKYNSSMVLELLKKGE